MNYSKFQNAARLLMVGASLFTAGKSRGVDFFLRSGTVTNTMPDGRAVVMWGFADDSAGAGLGVVAVPGPQLNVAAGDSLVIHLQNTLPDPVSVVIPGQYGFITEDPVFHTNGAYLGRARSFTHETLPATTGTYTWTNVQPGTFVYHSGSHPSVQVQMGLYGAVAVVAPGPQVYAGVPFNSQVTLLFSEIDPEVHDAVAGTNFGPGPAFLLSDFTNAAGFIAQVRGSADPVARFVASQLSGSANNLAADLNAIVGGSSIYNPTLFPDTILSRATLDLLIQAPEVNQPITDIQFNGTMYRLNRSLLQDGLARAGITIPAVKAMTSTIRSYPQYFLVNGAPYTNGTPAIVAGGVGATTLVRMLNLGMDAHVPTLDNGGDLTLVGEGGQQAPYTRNSAVVWMPAQITVDALWTPAAAGNYAIYDRRLGLVNGVLPGGGMLAYLAVGAAGSATGPAILVQPASQSVAAGSSATFSVIASSTGTLSYQWRSNGVNIVGATGASYTTPATTLADNGLGFSVVVANSVSSLTSSAAILSVR